MTTTTSDWSQRLHLWETTDGKLVGVAHPEGVGDVFLGIHPDYRSIEPDMLAWAEQELAVFNRETGRRQLELFVFDYDVPRIRLLTERGYEKTTWGGMTRHLRFGGRSLPRPIIAAGYYLRGTYRDDEQDYQYVADILNAGFNRSIHTAREFGNFATQSPSFRHELNLVAETLDGNFAALVGLTFDETNRLAILEPVCTHPEHRRKGLAQTLVFEGLHRVRTMGAVDVIVGTGDTDMANGFYEQVGFTEAYHGCVWRKTMS
jgi:predicted N-acetyltransferase YhbS